MLKTKNVYTNILDIKIALRQAKNIIAKLEKENCSLKKTLDTINVDTMHIEKEYMYYEHIHTIR